MWQVLGQTSVQGAVGGDRTWTLRTAIAGFSWVPNTHRTPWQSSHLEEVLASVAREGALKGWGEEQPVISSHSATAGCRGLSP